MNATAQCPLNIDFELGNFNNWTCYVGNTTANGNENQINLTASGPIGERHTMYSAGSGGVDPYGGFPVNCPNGSGNSIRLGNNTGGGEAEGISYQFTIPANRNEYSLIYHYAVVFQDPVHQIFQQPRMQVEILNVTDGDVIDCSSFTFIPFGTILPGFFQSSTTGDDGTPVWCKDWSAVSINLDGLAGKTIRLFFKTGDCTFRRHFGYAYIDVNSECSSEFVGAAYCPDDTTATVVAPYGYQTYHWYNSNFTQIIGTSQTITFSPPPAPGTLIAVEVIPYDGYGCIDTLYARMIDTMTTSAFAGADGLYCGDNPLHLGVNSKPGLVYSWVPDVGLSNPTASNPNASPDTTTTYVLSVRSAGGGCLNRDTVTITSSSVDKTIELIGKAAFCIGRNDSAVLRVNPADNIQWWRDGFAIAGANQPVYRVLQSGTYTARLTSDLGCTGTTLPQPIFIDKARPGITYPVEYAVFNLSYKLEARPFGANYLWNPSVYLDNPAKATPIFKSASEQLYTIRIETSTGCITIDTQQVKLVPSVEIYVPTGFTPNSDGKNDMLRPVLMGVKELIYFRVFNRWGQLLFESQKASWGWDGRLNGIPQQTSVVVWVAEALGSDGKKYVRKGTSALLR
jgi:gliding motility-associated-like protein